jgi:hypothetical protein
MKKSRLLGAACACVFMYGLATSADADVVAYDMVSSTSQNLISFTDDPAIPFTSNADGFQKFQRGVSVTIPFAVLDDSAGTFPPDTLGIIKTGNTDEFFGIVDTNNPDTGGSDVVSTWVFDISGASNLFLAIDMGAMGDFEAASDFFNWSYSIDGSPAQTAFQSSVDEASRAASMRQFLRHTPWKAVPRSHLMTRCWSTAFCSTTTYRRKLWL